MPASRLALRQTHVVPVLVELHAWLLAAERTVCMAAVGQDHSVCPDTLVGAGAHRPSESLPTENLLKNAVRLIAIGKTNWLFAGSERAGCSASPSGACLILPSLAACTQLAGLVKPWKTSGLRNS